MKVRIYRSLSGGVFSARIQTEDFTPEESRWIGDQGDPLVNVGGTFSLPGDESFVLPSKMVRVQSGFSSPGLVRGFSSADHSDAKERALSWASTVQGRIFQAMQDLKDNDVNDFEGETVESPTYT